MPEVATRLPLSRLSGIANFGACPTSSEAWSINRELIAWRKVEAILRRHCHPGCVTAVHDLAAKCLKEIDGLGEVQE
jgi:hypothetical protein